MIRIYPFAHPSYAPAARIAAVLRSAERIVVTAHASPDGDAVGSMAAMTHGLLSLGKRVALCNATGFPAYLGWLPVPGQVYKSLKEVPFTPDLALVLDCGDLDRLGRSLVEPFSALPMVNVDHHLGNPGFGTVDNWTEPRMAATGQMVAAILAAMKVPLRGEAAQAIYVALETDTGGFSFDNVTFEVFELMAYLVGQGLDVAALRRRMDNQWSVSRMRLWGRLLQSFSLHCDNRVALSVVSLATLGTCGGMKEDLEGFVEHLRRIKGVEVAALVREDTPHRSKISLRSSGPVDVRAMAAAFGGGGHRNAAGAQLHMPLEDATAALLATVEEHLRCNAPENDENIEMPG